LGTALTSVIFITAILVTVVYLTRTRSDVIEEYDATHTPIVTTTPPRERIMLGYFIAVAVAAGALLTWAAGQPHATTTASEEETSTAPATATLAPGQVTGHFPAAEIAKFRTITADTLAKVQSGDQAGATARIKDLEIAWDDDQPNLEPLDESAWAVLDGKIDSVLKSLRASHPEPATETQTLSALLTALH
jgi:hypothetical protein